MLRVPSMTFKYSLRFESGERRGEVVPLTVVAAQGGTFTIGRKPGNSLQVPDVSISGRHAELAIDEDGVSLRDLNSTNGTLVGGRKVRRAYLEPEDEFTLGAVEFTLLEGVTAAGGTAPAPSQDADPGELVLEDPTDGEAVEPVTRAASMPRKAPAPAPANAAPANAAPAPRPKAPSVPMGGPMDGPTEGIGETHVMPREDGLEITAEDLARSAKSSKLGPILLVGLAAVGGGAWWWLGQRADDEGGAGRGRQAALQAPVSPAGNLLSGGYSFEDGTGWALDADTATGFSSARSAARSGARGVQADLVGGESAFVESEAIRVPTDGSSIRALAFVAADSGIEARLGLRYLTGTGDDAIGVNVWSDPAPVSDEFQEVALVGTAPLGMSHVRVILRAECTDAEVPVSEDGDQPIGEFKSVSIDDVALVPTTDAVPQIKLDPITATALGGATASSVKAISLTSIESVLVSSLRVAEPQVTEGTGLGSQDIAMEAIDGGVSLTPAAGGTLVLRAEPLVVEGGIATVSSGGYASHGSTFTREGVLKLILGDGAQMVLLSLPSPTTVTARASGEGTAFRAEVAGGQPITLKTSFMEERTLAQRLARRAKGERSDGDSGAALATWNELLLNVPFDSKLIEEAAAAQSEMLGEGRAELKALTAEVERARFFGLADLYRQKLARAKDLSQRFGGTDLEAQSEALMGAIQMELEALDSAENRDELTRLDAIRSVLQRSGAGDLAKRVGSYRESEASEQARDDAGDTTPKTSGGQ